MKRRTGLSIQTKFFLGMALLPTILLFVYLFLVQGIFERTKIKDVLVLSQAITSSVSFKLQIEFDSVMKELWPIVGGYDKKQGSLNRASTESFEMNRRLRAFYLFELKNEKLQKPFELKKGHLEIDSEKLAVMLTNVVMNRFFVSLFAKNGSLVWFGIRFKDKVGDQYLILSLLDLPAFVNYFKNKSLYKVYLIDDSGHSIITPEGNDTVSSFELWDFIKKSDGRKSSEFFEAKSPSGEEWLISRLQTEIGNLFVLSMIERKVALSANRKLFESSAMFLLVLLILSILVSLIASKKGTALLRELFQATEKISRGEFDIRLEIRSLDEVGALAHGFNQMAGRISDLMVQTAEKARMEAELKMANVVQRTLLPNPDFSSPPFYISGHFTSASECGGDWWFYNNIGDNLFVWIGDVTGHGASAALITSAARAAVSAISEKDDLTPVEAIEFLNRVIFETSKGSMYMTFFVASFNAKNGTVTYANSGHESPLLFRENDNGYLRKNIIPLNDVNGPPLGDINNVRYQQTELKLINGDIILFHTDGIVEMENDKNEQWGERRFIKSVTSALKQENELPRVVGQIVTDSGNFRNKARLLDDMTFLFCRFINEKEII